MTNNRRSFLKDCFMIAAVSLLPKILRPMESEIESEYREWEVCFNHYRSEISEDGKVTFSPTGKTYYDKIRLPKNFTVTQS